MSATILIVDDEENARHNIGTFLSSQGYEISGVASLQEARDCIQLGNADIILLDVQLPDGYGPSLLEETAHFPNRPPILLITAYGDIEMAVEAMKNGAHDFLQKPIKLARLETSIQRAEEIVTMRRELAHLRSMRQDQLNFIIGSTQKMKILVDQAQRAPLFVGLLANVLARAGRVAEAESLLQELEQRSQTEYVLPSAIFGAAWFLGRHEQALAAAELCVEDRTAPFSLLATLGPFLEESEGDARFAAPFRAMQLPGWN